jgi:hypothetical protein
MSQQAASTIALRPPAEVATLLTGKFLHGRRRRISGTFLTGEIAGDGPEHVHDDRCPALQIFHL